MLTRLDTRGGGRNSAGLFGIMRLSDVVAALKVISRFYEVRGMKMCGGSPANLPAPWFLDELCARPRKKCGEKPSLILAMAIPRVLHVEGTLKARDRHYYFRRRHFHFATCFWGRHVRFLPEYRMTTLISIQFPTRLRQNQYEPSCIDDDSLSLAVRTENHRLTT